MPAEAIAMPPSASEGIGSSDSGSSDVNTAGASDFLSDFDMGGKADSAESKPAPDESSEAAKPEARNLPPPKPAPAPKPKPELAKPVEAKAKPTEAPPTKAISPMAMLREKFEQEQRQRMALEAEVKSYRDGKLMEHPEVKTIRQRLEAAEKRRQQLEEEIRFSAYERSQEYQDKYERPFLDAYQLGRGKVAKLEIVEQSQEDPATGEKRVLQQARPAAPEDFDRIMAIMNDREASKLAKQLFGDDAAMVMYHRERVMELNNSRHSAIEHYRKTGAETLQKQAEQEAFKQEQTSRMWSEYNKEVVERFPQWLKPDENDPEANKLLEAGMEMADRAFSGANGLSPEQTVRLHAMIRNRAGAFPRAAHMVGKLQAKVEELEAALAEYQKSEPATGEGKGQEKAATGFEELAPDA